MKHLNFLSNLLSLSLGSPCTDVSLDRRLTVGSPSFDCRPALLKLVSVLALIFTLGVGNVWGVDDSYTWNLSSGDLGSSGSPSSSVTKGTPSVTWDASYTWPSGASKYLGSDATKGVQVGSGSATNKCTTLVLSTSDISGTISNVTINTSGAASISATVGVQVGSTTFKYNKNNTASLTSTATSYSFTGSASGTITITWNNSSSKAMYIKSISVTFVGEKYTITYNAGSGTCATSTWTQTTALQSTTLPSATHSCDGWSFAGWCTSSAGSSNTNHISPGTILTGSYRPKSTQTLYAVYTKDGGTGTIEGSTTFDWTPTTTTGTEFTQDNITATFAKGSGGTDPSYNSTGTAMRLYYKNTLQFSGTSGITLKSVVFTTHSSNSEFLSGVSVTAGSLSSLTWSSINANSAKLTNGTVSSGHTRIQSALVTYDYTGAITYYMTNYVCCTSLGSINGSFFWTTLFRPLHPDKFRAKALFSYLHYVKDRFCSFLSAKRGTISLFHLVLFTCSFYTY